MNELNKFKYGLDVFRTRQIHEIRIEKHLRNEMQN